MAKLKTKTTIKQKVIMAFTVIAIFVSVLGILSVVGENWAQAFSRPFVILKKTYPKIPISPKRTAPELKIVPPHLKYDISL